MKRVIATVSLVAALLVGRAPMSAQGANVERALRLYKIGWESMHSEAWAEAAKQFQQAIDIDPKFALAYYALGRAEMALRNFAKAIDAYTKCRELYVAIGGEHFNSQLEATKRLDDRILETKIAIDQAGQVSAAKSGTPSQSLMVRELQNQLDRLTQAKERNVNISLDATVPYFVPLALGAAYFRSGKLADAEREDKTAIDANPKAGEAHNNLAVVYLVTGRLDAATQEVALAEKWHFRVNPDLKAEIAEKRKEFR
jgi:tetratricopeptide (TPR) repeat protein